MFPHITDAEISVHCCWIKSWRQSFGWSKKEYHFARQRGTQWARALKTVCPILGGFGVEFYSDGSRIQLVIRIRLCAGQVSQFSCSVMFDSLWSCGLQHTRPPCPSPTPRVYSNSCPLSRWCYPTISSSVVPFSHLQSLPASGSFPRNQFFASGGQSIGVSASVSVLPMNIQDWFSLDGLVGSPCCPRAFQESSATPQFKSIYSLVLSFLHSPTLTSILEWIKYPLQYFD